MDYIGDFGIFQHVLLWFCVFLGFIIYNLTQKRKYKLPPGPTGLPIVGILPFLGRNPHLELMKRSKKYGSIFSVYLGRNYVVVVTDAVIGKQILSKSSTSDRPPHLFEHLPDGGGFAELNGSEWAEQRRYTMMEMKNLGFGRSNWEKLVQMEISDFLDALEKSGGEPVDISHLLAASISNNIVSLVTNQRFPVGDPRRDAIDRGIKSFMFLHNQSGLPIYYPKLFKLLVSLGILKVGNQLRGMINMNKCIRQEIEELKKEKEGDSFISKYLTEIEKKERMDLNNSFSGPNLLGNVQALIIGGSDTTYISLLWLMLAMASFSKVQEKVHEELDAVLGRDGSADWVDRQKLPYCLATILEGQRWRTIVPLNLLHRTNEDMEINGYTILKGTDLMTVLWAFHHDNKYWKDPDMFQPERFLTNNGKTVTEPEAFLPFSHGKRICPGKTVALIELFQYFTSIMQKFQILPATETQLPDLEGFPGLTLQPKSQPLRYVSR